MSFQPLLTPQSLPSPHAARPDSELEVKSNPASQLLLPGTKANRGFTITLTPAQAEPQPSLPIQHIERIDDADPTANNNFLNAPAIRFSNVDNKVRKPNFRVPSIAQSHEPDKVDAFLENIAVPTGQFVGAMVSAFSVVALTLRVFAPSFMAVGIPIALPLLCAGAAVLTMTLAIGLNYKHRAFDKQIENHLLFKLPVHSTKTRLSTTSTLLGIASIGISILGYLAMTGNVTPFWFLIPTIGTLATSIVMYFGSVRETGNFMELLKPVSERKIQNSSKQFTYSMIGVAVLAAAIFVFCYFSPVILGFPL
jgi:hypothetical protein